MQSINWPPKCVLVGQFVSQIGVGEYFQAQPPVFLRRKYVVEVSGVANSLWTQTNINTIWPMMNSMKQNSPRLLSDVPDCSFGSPVLKMGVHLTVSEELLVSSTVGDEGVVGEAAVVCLIFLLPWKTYIAP